MIVYKFKVTFEDVDDVERVIEIRANQTFSDLYLSIVECIKFDPKFTASFFMSGDNWRKGREITNADNPDALQMSDCKLNSFVNDPHQKILLVTHDDFEWVLRVQLFKIEKANDSLVYPRCSRSLGEAPKQLKVTHIGQATNEFEELVDEIISEAEEPDTSEMGYDDGIEDEDDFQMDDED